MIARTVRRPGFGQLSPAVLLAEMGDNDFVGNPDLKPESSRGGEVSLRYSTEGLGGSLTYYHQRLKDEIVDVFDPTTFRSTTENAFGKGKRKGRKPMETAA